MRFLSFAIGFTVAALFIMALLNDTKNQMFRENESLKQQLIQEKALTNFLAELLINKQKT